MNECDIKNEMADMVANPGSWTIGITNDPVECRERYGREGKQVASWEEWEADSLDVAVEVERYWVNERGMGGGTGGTGPVYVYVF